MGAKMRGREGDCLLDEAGKADEDDGPLVYTIPEAGRMAEIGHNAAYRAAARGEIPTISFGHLKRVPGKRWRKMLAGESAG